MTLNPVFIFYFLCFSKLVLGETLRRVFFRGEFLLKQFVKFNHWIFSLAKNRLWLLYEKIEVLIWQKLIRICKKK